MNIMTLFDQIADPINDTNKKHNLIDTLSFRDVFYALIGKNIKEFVRKKLGCYNKSDNLITVFL